MVPCPYPLPLKLIIPMGNLLGVSRDFHCSSSVQARCLPEIRFLPAARSLVPGIPEKYLLTGQSFCFVFFGPTEVQQDPIPLLL